MSVLSSNSRKLQKQENTEANPHHKTLTALLFEASLEHGIPTLGFLWDKKFITLGVVL